MFCFVVDDGNNGVKSFLTENLISPGLVVRG